MTTQPETQPVGHERSFLSKLFEGLFILLLLAAVAGCDFYAAQAWRHGQAARSWPGATGVMHEFLAHRGGWNRDEIRYAVDLGYRYTVNDTTYAATNELPGLFLSSFAASQAAETLRAKGSYLPVFYNPRDPAESILSQACPRGVLMGGAVLALVTVLAAVWFGRRLARLATGREDFVIEEPSFMNNDDLPGLPTGLGSRGLRWFFALMGAVSCWWLARSIYQDWRLPVAERLLPSADLMLLMEFILAHSGMMVPGLLLAPNQTRQSKTEQMLILGLVYLTFATSIAAAAQSFHLFLMFSGLLISRWVGLVLDSNQGLQQQLTRSVETFLVLLFSIGVCVWLLKLPMDLGLVVYFCLIGLFEATLPARRKSWFQPPAAGRR